jgi:hypothetical protein
MLNYFFAYVLRVRNVASFLLVGFPSWIPSSDCNRVIPLYIDFFSYSLCSRTCNEKYRKSINILTLNKYYICSKL